MPQDAVHHAFELPVRDRGLKYALPRSDGLFQLGADKKLRVQGGGVQRRDRRLLQRDKFKAPGLAWMQRAGGLGSAS